MADVKLDSTITDKLKDSFKVTDDDIQKTLNFFNSTLKPAIKAHYLSHLVTSVEEMINENLKKELIQKIKNLSGPQEQIEFLQKTINSTQFRLFSIVLISVKSENRKAKSFKKKTGVIISYAEYLEENEKRFAIAHELGHIVNEYILHLTDTNKEYYASLFAYIALLDKNNFYQKEAGNYVVKTDLQLFNDYINTLHIS